jgi:putative tryptophan/tyrosine transport system substrate-binding protein
MNPSIFTKIFFLLRKNTGSFAFWICFVLVLPQSAYSVKESDNKSVAIIVSMKIRPYMEAVDGIVEELSRHSDILKTIYFLMDDEYNVSKEDFGNKLKEFSCHIAIGPEAARFLWGLKDSDYPKKIYSMVLDPDQEFGSPETACGISLNLPTQTQISIIEAAIPSVKKIGILFDPKYNKKKIELVKNIAGQSGLKITAVEVTSQKEIPTTLFPLYSDIDALWLIPDRTIISESIVQYIIKEALSHNVAVIGYNRFFYENGAVLCFVFDYREIGRQTAAAALEVISGKSCNSTPPAFKAWINTRVARKIDINPILNEKLGIMQGP